jgi:hypothetical protein
MNKSKYYMVTGDGPVQKAISKFIEQEAEFEQHFKKMSEKYNSKKGYVSDMILGFYFNGEKHHPLWTEKEVHPEGVFSPNQRNKEGKGQISELQSVTLPNRMFFYYIFPGSVILAGPGKLREPEFKQMEDNLIWKMPLNKHGEHCEIDMAGLKPISNITYLKLKGE